MIRGRGPVGDSVRAHNPPPALGNLALDQRGDKGISRDAVALRNEKKPSSARAEIRDGRGLARAVVEFRRTRDGVGVPRHNLDALPGGPRHDGSPLCVGAEVLFARGHPEVPDVPARVPCAGSLLRSGRLVDTVGSVGGCEQGEFTVTLHHDGVDQPHFQSANPRPTRRAHGTAADLMLPNVLARDSSRSSRWGVPYVEARSGRSDYGRRIWSHGDPGWGCNHRRWHGRRQHRLDGLFGESLKLHGGPSLLTARI